MAEVTEMKPGSRLVAFSAQAGKDGTEWTRAGSGFVDEDGVIKVWLDVLPVDGNLHFRKDSDEARER